MPTLAAPPHRALRRRAARAVAALAALAFAAACNDDGGSEDDEPPIQAVRLTVTPSAGPAVAYTITTTGATPSPVSIRVGTSTVTAAALDARNQTIALESDFELRVVGAVSGATETPLPAGFTFTPNGTLSSTITATSAVTTRTIDAAVRLFHRGEGHSDFDARFQLFVTP